MPELCLEIGVVLVRRRLASPWADHAWAPHSVLAGVPRTAPWTALGGDKPALYYAGAATLTLHHAATPYYRDNLASAAPSLWIALQPLGPLRCRVCSVTADPYEGEALTESFDRIVEPVAMPGMVARQLAAFCTTFYVERPFLKRVRDRADPEAFARRPVCAARSQGRGG
jgi:hypothetical protein